MFTINKAFVDSSVLIEAEKGNNLPFVTKLYFDASLVLCINEIVLSEFLFHFLSQQSGVAPLTLKAKKNVKPYITIYQKESFLENFEFIVSSQKLLTMVPDLMLKYDLLPNDAIILATCIINEIPKLASLDSDFKIPCEQEKIEFIHPDNFN